RGGRRSLALDRQERSRLLRRLRHLRLILAACARQTDGQRYQLCSELRAGGLALSRPLPNISLLSSRPPRALPATACDLHRVLLRTWLLRVLARAASVAFLCRRARKR